MYKKLSDEIGELKFCINNSTTKLGSFINNFKKISKITRRSFHEGNTYIQSYALSIDKKTMSKKFLRHLADLKLNVQFKLLTCHQRRIIS